MTPEGNLRPRGYAKPIVVADRFDLLLGPTRGRIQLPRHLKWSGSASYDLDQPGRIVDMYRTVLNEAAASTDLYSYLDGATLVALWPSLWLPAAVHQAWEDRFPQLARHRTRPAA
jgi:hypothetical protein